MDWDGYGFIRPSSPVFPAEIATRFDKFYLDLFVSSGVYGSQKIKSFLEIDDDNFHRLIATRSNTT